jgi:NADPH-dependent curcumin reductase CurA
VLGVPGFTAYVGITDVAPVADGDVVFVSGAAGAVGSIAGQIARLRGAKRVIGSAGTDAKAGYLTGELGFDAAFNYRSGDVRELLATAAPDGIDVYFDNVGGDHLEAAIGTARNFGRIAVCGHISQYNATEPPPGPRNLFMLVTKRLAMRGFLIIDHGDRYQSFLADMSGWLADGRIQFRETVVDGLENAPGAFLGLLDGQNTGKMLVRIPGAG